VLILGIVVAFVQNFVVLTLGLKEGAIWSSPQSFVGVLTVEVVAMVAAYVVARRLALRPWIVLATISVAIVCVGELVLPISSFRVFAQRVRRERRLDGIRLGAIKVESMPSQSDRRRVSLTYELSFPTPGHYLTFPAYIGPSTDRVFGDYDTTRHPELFADDFVFETGKPYRFVVAFDVRNSRLDLARDSANIDICDGKSAFMVCRIIKIGLAGPDRRNPTASRPAR